MAASIAVLSDQYLAEERFRLALFVTADIIVVTVLVWLNARKVKEEHYRRSRAEVELRELNLVATIRDRSAYPPTRTSKEAP